MAPRKAKGEIPEATKNLLIHKYGQYVPAQLTAGVSPDAMAERINSDTMERDVIVEKRDRNGKVVGEDEIHIGPLQVSGDQLASWFPIATAAGEPPQGYGPEDGPPDTAN